MGRAARGSGVTEGESWKMAMKLSDWECRCVPLQYASCHLSCHFVPLRATCCLSRSPPLISHCLCCPRGTGSHKPAKPLDEELLQRIDTEHLAVVEWSGGFYTAVTEMFGLKFWWRHEPSIRDMFWALSIDAEHMVDRVDTLRRPPPRIAPHAGTLMKALEYSKVSPPPTPNQPPNPQPPNPNPQSPNTSCQI